MLIMNKLVKCEYKYGEILRLGKDFVFRSIISLL